MTFDRVSVVERVLDEYIAGASEAAERLDPDAPLREGSGLTARKAVELFEDQVTSRAIDVAGRELKKTDRSFYTISSAGAAAFGSFSLWQSLPISPEPAGGCS